VFLRELLNCDDIVLDCVDLGVGKGSLSFMSLEVGEGFGVGGDYGVQIQRLGVGEVGVGNGDWDGGPVGAEPAAKAVGVVASAEVVVARFGVSFLPSSLVCRKLSLAGGVQNVWLLADFAFRFYFLPVRSRSGNHLLDPIVRQFRNL
jgi:hypothetical protein